MTQLENNDSNSAVQLTHVTRTYKRDEFEVRALDDVTLDIPRKSFVAIMGPSGSGKTTLLNLVTGIDHATSGRVAVGGEEISTMNEREIAAWRARHIGLVFQFYNLIPVLTAFENVELPLLLTHLSKADRKTHVESALKAVGLAERMGHYPRQLSGGQEQRVAIARAIVTDPTILVADEPTGDLDAKSAEEILILLTQLKTQFDKTIVMVSLPTFANQMLADTTSSVRILCRTKMGLGYPLPVAYKSKIATIPHVVTVAPLVIYGGIYHEVSDQFPSVATEAKEIDMWSD